LGGRTQGGRKRSDTHRLRSSVAVLLLIVRGAPAAVVRSGPAAADGSKPGGLTYASLRGRRVAVPGMPTSEGLTEEAPRPGEPGAPISDTDQLIVQDETSALYARGSMFLRQCRAKRAGVGKEVPRGHVVEPRALLLSQMTSPVTARSQCGASSWSRMSHSLLVREGEVDASWPHLRLEPTERVHWTTRRQMHSAIGTPPPHG
jgi:hypothetical protein